MIADATKALRQMFTAPFRQVLFLSLAGSIVVLALFGAGLQWAANEIPEITWSWLAWANDPIDWVVRSLAVVILIPLVLPVATVVAGMFLEQIAAKVEETDYPAEPAGRDLPLMTGLWVSIKFLLVMIVVNLIALPLYFVPVVNLFVFWVVNGYLLGREYFELVAFRHHPRKLAIEMRQRHGLRVFAGGVIVAAFATIPFVNLLAPLFGTAMFVHVYHRFEERKRLAHV